MDSERATVDNCGALGRHDEKLNQWVGTTPEVSASKLFAEDRSQMITRCSVWYQTFKQNSNSCKLSKSASPPAGLQLVNTNIAGICTQQQKVKTSSIILSVSEATPKCLRQQVRFGIGDLPTTTWNTRPATAGSMVWHPSAVTMYCDRS